MKARKRVSSVKPREADETRMDGTTVNKAREFGVAFESSSAKEYIAAARLAEELGFGTFWVPEDPVFPGAFATPSAIATNTKKIRSESAYSIRGRAPGSDRDGTRGSGRHF